MTRGKNTYKAMRSKAWQDGFHCGHAGDLLASPRYIVSSQTERLIWEWRQGFTQGLEEHKRDIEKERLEKKYGW